MLYEEHIVRSRVEVGNQLNYGNNPNGRRWGGGLQLEHCTSGGEKWSDLRCFKAWVFFQY